MMILKSAMWLLAATALSVALVGCSLIPYYSTVENQNDVQWMNSKLGIVTSPKHFVQPMVGFDNSSRMTRQEWILATVPFPDQKIHRVQEQEFFKVKGDEGHSFLLIKGSDLLIHETGGQCTLFDPQTGKDVSKPFPAALLFNRSRTACVIMVNGKTTILDTLSALTDEPRILAQPQWSGTLERLKFGGLTAHLTDDSKYLVLLPNLASPSYVTAANFKVEAFSTNGNHEYWSIPLERKWEDFVDTEVVNGKILILSRLMLANGAEDEIKLINMKGETMAVSKIPADTRIRGNFWNPASNSILFPPYEISALHHRSTQTFYLWNYSSNALQSMSVWK